MAESLFELLVSDVGTQSSPDNVPLVHDSTTAKYLLHLSTLSLSFLATSEPQLLAQASHSLFLSLQALSTRSQRSITTSVDHLSDLSTSLPSLAEKATELQATIPKLDEVATRFSQNYNKNARNDLLERRRKAMLLARNVDRLSDILDLPSLLSTAISSSASSAPIATSHPVGSSPSGPTSYSSALDLYTHIKRLHSLYPRSPIVTSLMTQAEEEMQRMTVNLITGLRAPSLKLAAAMRMIGWLKRVAPDLDGGAVSSESKAGQETRNGGGSLGALFLVCRLANLNSMVEALDPLRELAEQEFDLRVQRTIEKSKDGSTPVKVVNDSVWSNGQHTERYLKRYLEVFREQSFAILSMYRSIFPSSTSGVHGKVDEVAGLRLGSATPRAIEVEGSTAKDGSQDPLLPLPSPACTFPLRLVEMLTGILKRYLPSVQDKSARESLLTQVLYCAGSLGRLGGDFSLLLASLDLHSAGDGSVSAGDESDSMEWVNVMKKHRQLAGRLDLLASGLGVHDDAALPTRRKG